MQFVKVISHSQVLQNIGYVSHVVQYTLEPILHPVVLYHLRLHPYIALYSPLVTTSLCSIPVSLLLFVIFTSLLYTDIIQYLSFSVWLISLSIMPSKFIHIITKYPPFLWLCSITCIYTPHHLYPFICFFIFIKWVYLFTWLHWILLAACGI